MTALRRTATAAAMCVGLLLAAGCSDDPEGTQPLPSPSETTTPTTTGPSEPPATSSTPTPTTPAWQDKYNADEIAVYEEALDRFATYEQRSEPIWRRGKATPAALQLFKDYFYTWQSQFRTLETYEQANVELRGTPTTLESRPTRIAVSKDGQSVTIRQCIDYSTSQLLQNGEEAPGKPDGPRLRSIVLSRSLGAEATPWRITVVNSYEGDRKC